MLHSNSPKPLLQVYPLDRAALALMAVLTGFTVLLLLTGDITTPKVRDFSWQNRQVGATDTAFLLTFNRPMDHSSVEKNLQIDPPLPGRMSWSGRRMAYTLNHPAPYGINYTVQLRGAYDRFLTGQQSQSQPFTGTFQSRDRAFVYQGVENNEKGRLVLYNLTRQQKTILTPANLTVMDFKLYPKGDRILFSAVDSLNPQPGLINQKLYTITTGINPFSPDDSSAGGATAGQLTLILDANDYQNLKFDLSSDGSTIVIKRISRKNPGSDGGIWVIRSGESPQEISTQASGDFLITPDGSSLAIAQGQGLALLPLCQQTSCTSTDSLEFLPKFGMVLNFSATGQAAAMVKFNTDYTRSIFWVNSQGQERELIRFQGTILKAQFDPTNKWLYCLLTQLVPGTVYQEQPQLVVINLSTGKATILNSTPLELQQDTQSDLAPDGLAILYDQAVTQTVNGKASPVNKLTSKIFLLPVTPSTDAQINPQPEMAIELPFRGFHPAWLP